MASMSSPQPGIVTHGAQLVVVGEVPEAVGSIPDLQVVVDAKVRRPQIRRSTLQRPRLTDRLVAGAEFPLVVVSAPTGFGKATLLTEWAELDDRPFAWLSLDRGDDDPVRLLTSMSHALSRIRTIDPALFNDLASSGISILGQAVPRLVASIRFVDRPCVLVLSNLHRITSQECRDAIDLFVDLLPPGVQVAVSSRESVWLATGRRSMRGEILEIGPTDLAFDDGEIQQLLTGAGLPAGPERVQRLMHVTEGWPAGVYLTALAPRRARPRAPSAPDAPPERVIADFIRREVLSALSSDTLHFLQATAILEVMCAPLCDAVTDSIGSGQMLESLERSNLFMVPLDDRGEWYRYHPLFRSVLLDEITRDRPDVVAALHLRAAQWWEAAQSVERTIFHARAAGDPAPAIRLLTTQLPLAYSQGRMDTVERWLRDLGDATIEGQPMIAAMAGWVAAVTGQPIAAMRWSEHIARSADSTRDDTLFDNTRGALRAFLCAHGPTEMGADAALVVANEPVWGPWRPAVVGYLAVARWLAGDADGAQLLFSESIEAAASAPGFGDPLARNLSYRAVLAMDQNDWLGAAADVARARSVIETAHMSEYSFNAVVSAASARLALHRNETEVARAELLQAMRLRSLVTWASPWAAVWLRLEMADAHLALADPNGARTLVHEIDDILYHRPKLGVLNARIEALRELLTKWPTDTATSSLSAAELRLLPYLQTHLSLKQIGQRLYISRNTVATEATSIYRKLGASGRNEAVDRARELGLLAPSIL